MFTEIKGDLIKLGLERKFDVIAHGCNCFCTMGAGIAPQMAKAFGCDKFKLEGIEYMGDINKLGQIDYQVLDYNKSLPSITVVNCYSQFGLGINHAGGTKKPLDYSALRLCMRKMNFIFKGKHIGLPWIGCGLAGGSILMVQEIIKTELKDCKVTLVEYENQSSKATTEDKN